MMKNICIILMNILLGSSLLSQNSLRIDSSTIHIYNNESDSFVTDKVIYSYNSNFQIESKTEFSLNVNNMLFPMVKNSYEYTQSGLVRNYIYSIWNLDWEFFSKETYFYNNKDLLSKLQFSNWNNDLMKWDSSYNTFYDYDKKNNRIYEISEGLNYFKNDWRNESKEIWRFENDSFLTIHSTYTWDSAKSNWEGYFQETFKYSNQKKVSYNWFLWNSGVKNWKLITFNEYDYYLFDSLQSNTFYKVRNGVDTQRFEKDICFYDSNSNLLINMNELIWSIHSSKWDTNYLTLFSYNHNYKLIEKKVSWYNSYKDRLEGYEKLDIVYSNDGKRIKKIYSVWDNNDSCWIYDIMKELIFDNDSYLVAKEESKWNTDKWIKDKRYSYFYSQYDNIEKTDNLDKIHIYPNPVTNRIYFIKSNLVGSIISVSILDMNGRVILVNNDIEEVIDVSTLNKGSYLLLVHLSNRSVLCSRFIKI